MRDVFRTKRKSGQRSYNDDVKFYSTELLCSAFEFNADSLHLFRRNALICDALVIFIDLQKTEMMVTL
jgi:hypothetical protein